MKARLTTGWLLGVAAQLSVIGLLLTSGWLITRAAEHPPVLYLMVAIVAVRAFGIGRSVLRYGERIFTHDAAFRMLTTERVNAYRALDRAAPIISHHGSRGDAMSRVVADIDALGDRQLRVRIPGTINACAYALVIAVAGWIHLPSGVILGGVVVVLQLGLPLLVRVQSAVEQRAIAELNGRMAADLAEAIATAPDLVAHGATRPMAARITGTDERLVQVQKKTAWLTGLGSTVVLLAVGAALTLVAWSCTIAVAQGQLQPVMLAVVVLAPIALLEPLDAITVIEQHRLRVQSSAQRVKDLAYLPQPVTDPVESAALPSNNAYGDPGAAGVLVARNLAVGWQESCVTSLDLSLHPGDTLAICGPSGSGKSTLALTLVKLLERRGGSVSLGGVSYDALTGEQLRQRIGLLQQDEQIFATSIRENLRIAKPDTNDHDLFEALDRVGLSALIRTLPNGLDTHVGEHGNRLSGGERQRLALARLLLAEHQILILDEPTEHVDRAVADELLTDILALAPQRSIIVITHAEWVRRRIGSRLDVTSPAESEAAAGSRSDSHNAHARDVLVR